ncbi:multidrug ABC transporter ATP-binding protein [Leucobacter sp. OLJS4]|uniref:ABC transporter ATP-binding protein n=2 Tax=unclassified Leucobacter TaxID=2621730 RepID=UPI000C199C80|nr:MULTISPECIES: ABC transporter ATP-binding protein [unclassified Leucobacter]PII84129.1 multidrug ABC transporter ATP-binding protein [Leucobacter sp. OLCALW19]PII88377.1 multidrug ABC transporter ATP-binding protein [Leucobacter sp. OLTLW20]PII92256.1 multidrug ABC transporter ATP-binding protein [Leucobacter sp. OLAS13]PII97560.1 multidrug ABC transporter ATP-binding protein [Leucobacter sp. OLCS4]PII99761.1 multidrug ABC transporter ATP-binding protein [Leucobacter sp. OLDS2]
MALLRLSWQHAKPYWPAMLAVLILQLLSTIAALWLPSLNAQIIDTGIAKGDIGYIWSTGGTMLAVCLMQVITAIGGVYFGARVSMAAGRDLRRSVYRKVDSLSTLEATRFGAGTLITRGTNDVQQVQMLILMTLNFMVTTPIMCIGGIIMALREDAGMSWLVWVSVSALAVIVGFLVWLLLPLFRNMQARVDDINGVLREQIMGIRVVRAFVRENFESDRYEVANRNITRISVQVGNVFVLMFPVIMMILHLATGAVLWFGGHRVDEGSMEVGSLTAFMQYLIQILVAVMMGVFMTMMIPRAVVCAERIRELLDTRSELEFPESEQVPSPTAGRIAFDGVTFGFPGAELPVIKNVSFVAEPGKTTAIIGSTGSGKTTLLNLMLRLFDAQSGRITIDGQPVSALTREQLARTVSLVPQRPYLFSGTIGSNLRFGKDDATDAELWEALRVAQGDDFVREKEQQLDEPMAQGGTSVSGGQRQRLSIARALVAKPLVYLFDDSFSALDVATDARLRAALPDATAGATTIIVAQRVSTITEADQILVVEDGEIVGRGTHSELLADNSVYQEIVRSQLEEAEAV